MKKFLLSAFVIISFALYVLRDKTKSIFNSNTVSSLSLIQQSTLSTPAVSKNQSTNTGKSVNTQKTNTRVAGTFKNGEFVGDVTDAYYGLVQVKVIITNGQISDVVFLKYPNDRSTSIYINSQAMPYLRSEAIQAQSAKVNIVSGATATSQAYRESLNSALSKAII